MYVLPVCFGKGPVCEFGLWICSWKYYFSLCYQIWKGSSPFCFCFHFKSKRILKTLNCVCFSSLFIMYKDFLLFWVYLGVCWVIVLDCLISSSLFYPCSFSFSTFVSAWQKKHMVGFGDFFPSFTYHYFRVQAFSAVTLCRCISSPLFSVVLGGNVTSCYLFGYYCPWLC